MPALAVGIGVHYRTVSTTIGLTMSLSDKVIRLTMRNGNVRYLTDLTVDQISFYCRMLDSSANLVRSYRLESV